MGSKKKEVGSQKKKGMLMSTWDLKDKRGGGGRVRCGGPWPWGNPPAGTKDSSEMVKVSKRGSCALVGREKLNHPTKTGLVKREGGGGRHDIGVHLQGRIVYHTPRASTSRRENTSPTSRVDALGRGTPTGTLGGRVVVGRKLGGQRKQK